MILFVIAWTFLLSVTSGLNGEFMDEGKYKCFQIEHGASGLQPLQLLGSMSNNCKKAQVLWPTKKILKQVEYESARRIEHSLPVL